MHTDYTGEELQARVGRELGLRDFECRIEKKSLDARKKADIHWRITVGVSSPALKGGTVPVQPPLEIPRTGRGKRVLVVGSGPAGFFAALVLRKAGFEVTLIERGREVFARAEAVTAFEQGGAFDEKANYLFGEGGAGTFSDGKLTSRSKRIGAERRFILDAYVRAGAPEEITYMAHPHLGSDRLKTVVRNLRNEFLHLGGTVNFETRLLDLEITGSKVTAALTDRGDFESEYFIIAPGHSAYETYRMLMGRGVGFRPKNFALGSRAEHPRELINEAQWGRKALPGVKAAEYRLTASPQGFLPSYTFCMCPGGVVVPATAYPDRLVVNGMSYYSRDMQFSNAACVVAVNPFEIIGAGVDAEAVLRWIEDLEHRFYDFSRSFRSPSCGIDDFLRRREPAGLPAASYPLGLVPAPLWDLLPERLVPSLTEGLEVFSRKLTGFETGILIGLESKTSAPLQVLRNEALACPGFENLYVAGEGGGYSGGIVSSAADGIRAALAICGT